MSKYPEPKYSKLLDADTQLRLKVMHESATAAVAESSALGLPQIVWRDGGIVYVFPDGTETTERPEILKSKELLKRK